MDSSPLHSLSLARTALNDPAALPPDEDLNRILVSDGLRLVRDWDRARIEFAIAQIDHAIGGLYFEPYGDPAREADVTLGHLGDLVSSVIEGLEDCGSYAKTVACLREAVTHLGEARAILSSR